MGVQTMASLGGGASGSVYSLTLTEVESQLGEPLRSMNLDDLLRSVLPAAEPATAGKKTVDEVWRDIQSAGGQPTMGEMTLEDFLSRAGVAVDGCAGPHWLHHHHYQPPQLQYPRPLNLGLYRDGFLSPVAGRKRGAEAVDGGVVERTVERRQKRMIKNRESAARSRARKQAYTNELENKVARLEEENERLRKLKMLEPLVPPPPPGHESRPVPENERRPVPPEHKRWPEPKKQLRRINSARF
ncbi:hypothetical protein QOZ80_7AG0582470 [Eleusine coracana subsp. coracana]|nr:hypothetical protein QOZ80_7AG0582470 [Eleusine coracana subsp. coracana]